MANSYFKSDFNGSKRERTHEGFLLCRDVRVARTGEMLYAAGEVPIKPAANGIIRIYRDSETLFDKITLESGVGKSVTIAHPENDVDPSNWKEISIGTSLNCRQGFGVDSEYMLMDLIIQDEYGIEQIEKDLVEISLGYEAKYIENPNKVGSAVQTNMIINHIALVERGRCGKSCSIRDKQTVKTKEGRKMPKPQMPRTLRQLFRDAFRTGDAEEFEEILDAAEEEWQAANKSSPEPIKDEGAAETDQNAVHLKDPQKGSDIPGGNQRARFNDDAIQQHIDQNSAEHADFRKRLEAIEKHLGGGSSQEETIDGGEELEKFLEDEAPDDVDLEEVKKTKDSRYLVDSLINTMAMAEIIAPGISMPTADASAAAIKTAKSICNLRKKALKIASTNDSAGLVFELNSGKELNLDRMSCSAARQLFTAVALSKRNENRSSVRVKDHLTVPSNEIQRQPSIRELNEFNRQRWSKK